MKNVWLSNNHEWGVTFEDEAFFFLQTEIFPDSCFWLSLRRNEENPEHYDYAGAPNENIVQNHFNMALLNVF